MLFSKRSLLPGITLLVAYALLVWKCHMRNASLQLSTNIAPTLTFAPSKTVAFKQINKTRFTQINWILFYFEHETNRTLHDKLYSSDFEFSTANANIDKCDCSNIEYTCTKNVRIIFEANKLKHCFWQHT